MTTPLSVPCPHCGALNRVPAERLGEQPVCGRCKQRLFQGHPIDLTATNFDSIASRGDLPVLIDFWATWCGPCQSFAPTFTHAARTMEPRLRFAKVDTDAQPTLTQRFAIRSIPTLLLLRGGKEIARQAGALSAGQLRQFIDGALR